MSERPEEPEAGRVQTLSRKARNTTTLFLYQLAELLLLDCDGTSFEGHTDRSSAVTDQTGLPGRVQPRLRVRLGPRPHPARVSRHKLKRWSRRGSCWSIRAVRPRPCRVLVWQRELTCERGQDGTHDASGPDVRWSRSHPRCSWSCVRSLPSHSRRTRLTN